MKKEGSKYAMVYRMLKSKNALEPLTFYVHMRASSFVDTITTYILICFETIYDVGHLDTTHCYRMKSQVSFSSSFDSLTFFSIVKLLHNKKN